MLLIERYVNSIALEKVYLHDAADVILKYCLVVSQLVERPLPTPENDGYGGSDPANVKFYILTAKFIQTTETEKETENGPIV